MKKLFLILIFLVPVLCFAQMQQVGNLTVFSEDGDKFYLVLNGEKLNAEPQSNIKIEELPQPYYSAKIIFEDTKLATISKSNLMITDADGKFMDVTYRIKKDKTGKVKLVYYSMIPVPQDFIPPSGMYVEHYGHPGPVHGVTQQTTTTTTTSDNAAFGANVNVPGVSMNVTITDPNVETNTTTTTTTTNATIRQEEEKEHHAHHSGHGCMNGWQMNAADFSAAKKTISEANFEETKLKTAKSIVSANCLSTDQVVAICNLFSFEDNKLAFAKYAYKYTTDPKNYFKVSNVFSFSSSKDELADFIEKQ